jgi:hypothetical protein
MKKVNLKKMVILGVATGLVVSPCLAMAADTNTSKPAPTSSAPAGKNISEDELLSSLDPKTKELYKSLSPEGKQLAINYALQTCANRNGCQYGGGAFKDKNAAVQAAAQKIMSEKRSSSY